MAKKLLFMALCILVFYFPLISHASANITVVVNGEKVNFTDQQPFIDSNSRTMVPIRFISEALDAKVDWIEKSACGNKKAGNGNFTGCRYENRKVNGKEIKLDTSSVIAEAGLLSL